MSKFLMHERPLTVLPTLVAALGFEKAVVLQQIYWLQNQPRSGRILEDGYKWVWGTYDEWCNLYFPFWAPRTLRKHITDLERTGLVLSCQPKAANWDRTKHYRVNEAALNRRFDNENVTSMRPSEDASSRPAKDTSMWPPEDASNYDSSATSIGTESSYRPFNKPVDADEKGERTKTRTSGPPKTRATIYENPPPEILAATTTADEEFQETPEHQKVFNFVRAKLGKKRDSQKDLLAECLGDHPDRQAWLELPLPRVLELSAHTDKQTRGKGGYKAKLIEALDQETRSGLQAETTPTPPRSAAPPRPGRVDTARLLAEIEEMTREDGV